MRTKGFSNSWTASFKSENCWEGADRCGGTCHVYCTIFYGTKCRSSAGFWTEHRLVVWEILLKSVRFFSENKIRHVTAKFAELGPQSWMTGKLLLIRFAFCSYERSKALNPCQDGDNDHSSRVPVAHIDETLIHWISWLTDSISGFFELKIDTERQELLITWSGE